ncbi:MAG: endolytic transglycosylase MltG [Holosporales bacterium]|jgi:UPF0755 protein|nr:endolytic transglycosylase MltG [Holosporales bacterium]
MFKLFSWILKLFFGLLIYIFSSLFRTSRLNDHSFFFVDRNNIYADIKKDKSFHRPTIFFFIEIIGRLRKRLQPGEYLIRKNESILSVLQKMFAGDAVTRKLTIPEGFTTQMIVEIINDNDLLTGEIKEIPEEGSLMPDTYFYKFHDKKATIIEKMRIHMQNMISQLERKNKTKLNMKEILILASIIEKETGLDEERPIVSSVYHNRLKKQMRLQSCPTVIYAISNGYGRINKQLTKDDLRWESPYNTYRVKGMPPSPICCPGRKAMEAAMNPATTNHLYFVLSGDGVHHQFSEDFKNQIKNKRIAKQQKKTTIPPAQPDKLFLAN